MTATGTRHGEDTAFRFRCKYALDRVIGVVGLAAAAPVIAIAGAAIRLDDGGPIFFRQERAGRGGLPIQVWKLRTMLINADDYLDEDGRPTRDRITRPGAWLRRYSIDEIPQLINIALGEMSLVGPRPALLAHVARYDAEQMRRLRVKPGITGLAQVSGRNQIRWSKRITIDNWYIDNYSFSLDIQVLAKTVVSVIKSEDVAVDRNPEFADDLPTAPQ